MKDNNTTRGWILETQRALEVDIFLARNNMINRDPKLLTKMWLRLEYMKRFGRLKPDEDLHYYRLGERDPVFHVE